jgi:hypothetical protein
MGSVAADVDIDAVMTAIDTSGDGLVEKDEFAPWYFSQVATIRGPLLSVCLTHSVLYI